MKRFFVVITLLTIWFGFIFVAPSLFKFLIAVLGIVLIFEIFSPFKTDTSNAWAALEVVGAIICILTSLFFQSNTWAIYVFVYFGFLGLSVFYFSGKNPSDTTSQILIYKQIRIILILSLVYVWFSLTRVFQNGENERIFIFLTSCIWFRDISASGLGRYIRTNNLIAETINKSKNWEVAILSTLMCVGYCIFFNAFLPTGFSLKFLIILGVICGLGGQLGDLAGSAIKRFSKKRHSSKIFSNAQGGVLDAFDGFLVVFPVYEALLSAQKLLNISL